MAPVSEETARTLVGSVGILTDKVRVGKKLLVAVVVSVVFNLILSLGLIYSLHNTNLAERETRVLVEQVAQNRAAIKAACDASNDQALKEHQLWQGLLALPSSNPPPDPATLVQFNRLLDETFPQKDCSQLG